MVNTYQGIREWAQKIRVSQPDNEYLIDFDETYKKIEDIKGYTIAIEELDNMNLSGRVRKEENRFFIALNKFESEERKTFTTAHELGHIVLGHEFPEESSIIEDPMENILGRDFGENSRQEREANQFAGELLMPNNLVKKIFPIQYLETINEIEDAANTFGVSRTAMMVRLQILGYKF